MKRTIALLLTLIMVLGMAVPAFADGEPSGEAGPPPTAEPEATAVPEATVVPEATAEPEATAVPEATAEPEATLEPEATMEPVATLEPVATAGPTASPEPTATPEPTASPEPAGVYSQEDLMLLSGFAESTAQVDVVIRSGMDLAAVPVFDVSLTGSGVYFADREVAADGTRSSFVQVPSSAAGNTYELTVTAPGFIPYTQSIDLYESDGVLVQLVVGQVAGFDDPNAPHPGVILPGVQEIDASEMMAAVANGGGEGFDLTGDGVVDLADAEYYAKNRKAAEELPEHLKTATLEHFVAETSIALVETQTTQVGGNVSDLFRPSDQGITLGTKAEGMVISADTPVEVTFGLGKGAKSDEILIENTTISSGEIEVTYFDESRNADVTVMVPIGEPAPAPAPANEMPLPGALPQIASVPVTETVTGTETFEENAAPAPETAPDGTLPDEPPAQTVPEEGQDAPAPVDETLTYDVATIAMPEVPQSGSPWLINASGSVQVKLDAAGNITVELGGQVAVKKVTLRITGTTAADKSLASISHVEFVNGMADRIPEPEPSVPDVFAAGGSRQFTVSWSECTNITGYEVQISDGALYETVPLTGASLTVTNFNNDEVLNYTTYTVCVRSVNGAWKSDWSAPVSVTPKPTGRPDAPDNVKATGGFQSVTVSWKNMKDTASYDLYYRRAADTEAAYTAIPGLTVTSYVITGLDSTSATAYEVYVVGVNEFGSSPESMHASAVTTAMLPAEMPRFNLINRDEAGNPGSWHITSAVMPNGSGILANSPADAAGGTAWGTVDNDPASYYERATWDDGGYNNLSDSVGLIYTFDQAYEMDTIGMMSVDSSMDYTYIKIRWWDAAGAVYTIDRSVMSSERRTDSQGRTYFFLRMPAPITAQKIQIGVARYWAGNNRIAVSDIYFYKYNELKRELAALYADDLHTTLREDGTITEQYLNDLRARIDNSRDEFGNEDPDKAQLVREWETAWQIYNDQFLSKVTRVHTGITASGDNHGFGGLNAWQPLGVVAAAGEKITVYVGSNLRKTGSATNLQLIATQYFAEASAMSTTVQTLRVGANEVMVPKVWTTTGVESGGALYVQYTGGAGTVDEYAVRVSGGVSVPVLDLYGVTDPGERLSRTSAYLSALQTYSAAIEATHADKHEGDGFVSAEVKYPYAEQTCILQATDIMLDTMMLSLPVRQIISGCGGSADTLLRSLDAMESMMGLFYQHKGLNANAKEAVDRIPLRHLNIRYQRMFSGAFMYASGDHIGIGWNETAGMAGCGGVVTDGSGRYVSGNYFGWGIAHEIGHDINQGTYAIAEITNNYFAVLAQAQDNNGSVRFEYPKVYEKVTSGTKGRAGNVFTQLGMYWQLHLAYDKGWNFRTYADYDEQLASLFWARVDTYARTPSRAPGGLSLEGADMEQALMRLCCAAAERNILDFFERWGKTPDEATIAYAQQFDKETRAIYYVCDDSRAYTLTSGGTSKLAADGSTDAIDAVSVQLDPDQANKVDITITPGALVGDGEVLGYEIVRCTIAGGATERKTVGFTTTNTFSDVVYAMNNRTVFYEVTLVDQYLNRSAVESTGMVKIQHEGVLAKNSWTVSTAGLDAEPIKTEHDNDDPDSSVEDAKLYDAAAYIADGKVETVYAGTVDLSKTDAAVIEIDFHETNVITGFICKPGASALGSFDVYVRQSGEWLLVKTHAYDDTKVYFANAQGSYVSTYDADALRFVLHAGAGTALSIAELDVMGPSGDNVDFRTAGGTPAIGLLSEAFPYGDGQFIPKGSLVFTGSYKGNAAYNVVMVYDQTGTLVTGVEKNKDGLIDRVAYQTILSKVPDTGNIQDVADGTWVYWIEPQHMDMNNGFVYPQQVRVELYRVNDATNNEGERLVSDSVYVDVPADPPKITLGGNG